MILRSLRLTNFRQYQTQEVIFPYGLTGIVGRNGAGKSTILEALLWCLYGNRAARTSKEGIRCQTAAPSQPCEVKLTFELGGKAVTLTRSLIGRTNRSEALLVQEGQLGAVTTREVDEYVIKLIGLDLKGFLSSFFARQRELNVLTDARPADRKDHLAAMLGVGRLDQAIVLLKDDIKSTRQAIELLESRQIDPTQVAEELSRTRADLEAQEKTKTTGQEELRQIGAQVLVLEQQGTKLREDELRNIQLDRQISVLTAQNNALSIDINRLAAEVAELGQVAEKLGPLAEQVQGIELLRQEVETLKQAEILAQERDRLLSDNERRQKVIADRTKERTELQDQVAGLARELSAKDSLSAALADGESNRERLRNEYREATSDLKVITKDMERLQKQKGEIQKLGPKAVCQSCLRPFGSDYEEIERHFDEELLTLQKKGEPSRHRLAEIEKEGGIVAAGIEQLRKEMERLTRLEQEAAAATARLTALENAIKESEATIGETGKRLAEIGPIAFDRDRLTALETVNRERLKQRDEFIRLSERMSHRSEAEAVLQKRRTELNESETVLANLAAEKKLLGFDEAIYRKGQSDLVQARQQVSDARLRLERVDGDMRLLMASAGTLSERLANYETAKAEISRRRENWTYLEKLSLLFADFRVHLIGRIRPALSRHTSELFHEMTGGRYQEVELDEDYSLCLYDRGEKFPITRFSGGEIDLLNLCFRLAISVEMATSAGIDHSFIILDEVFGSQDTERQRMIIEGLNRLMNRFQQIIIVSHIDDVKEMVEHIIAVEVDRSGFSRATISEGK